MRVLIIYRVGIHDITTKGIHRKQESQARAFRRLGHECDTIAWSKEGICLNNRMVSQLNFRTEPSKSFQLFFHFFRSLPSIIEVEYDIIYIRYSPLSWGLSKMIDEFKVNMPAVKVVLEFPTFPFIEEYSGLKRWIAGKNLKSLSKGKEIDLATVLDDRAEIMGIPCLKIANGVEVDKFPIKQNHGKGDGINLIFTGNISRSQGLERVIRGMINYYRGSVTDQIKLHVVGSGKEEDRIRILARPLGDNVVFHGNKYGEELDVIFNESDIAIGNLGMYQIGFDYSSGLKHREYCARGIPFIYGCKDDGFEELDFALRFPNDNSVIPMLNLLKFRNEVSSPETMRAYAKERLSWEMQMKKVVDFIQS